MVGNFNLFAQQDCLPETEMQGILPPPPMSQYCEDEEGHTIFFQFANVNLGSYCDMTLVSNGTDPYGDIIDNSEMRLWDYMEALLDECARDTLCNGGYYQSSQQAVNISFKKFCETKPCNYEDLIYVYNSSPGSNGVYTGIELDHQFDRFKWTAQHGKSLLPDPKPMCQGNFCGVWLVDDFEIYGDIQNPNYSIKMEVTYKLACCPCWEDDNNDDDFPPDLGNGNQ